ncbi:transport system permease protein [Beutenbergia cavernae DSM 12333]|uniref:Transport system permease protein n=1 Tax=Beutenbergia cavernae (strain ATCC BAA-8 / DSM 12333 / CCUG 43141 / JCM 11478 / NBRC 16432 / NCIMB 13614 / HKI 0122) TaxID=471853 RepID=C5BVF7_BEUC1|nr:iron ABC transporter permease [Beutenbergia cavernae]ACQ80544.1 transport system permease protein [Beutenbergia cavernae DSM 12333]
MSASAAGSSSDVDDPAAIALPDPTGQPHRVRRSLGMVGVYTLTGALVALLCAVHVTQGTSDLGAFDLLMALFTGLDDTDAAVLVASRLPRLGAGVIVGVVLGAAGSALQSVARNPLASPDTLGVNAGGYFAVVAVAAFGLVVPLPVAWTLAFLGGLAAAALVLTLSRAGAAGPTRLVLAGSAITLALSSVTSLLLILRAQETTGLFAWGAGSIVQSGAENVLRIAPVALVGVALLLLYSRRLDLLALGDDAARVLGVDVRRTRAGVIVVAVLLAASAVSVAGPIGFVGLAAPVIARLLARLVPGMHHHAALIPLAALTGVGVVIGADVLIRIPMGGQGGVLVPTGVVTSILGAIILVVLARRLRDSGSPVAAGIGARLRTVRWAWGVAGVLLVCVVAAAVAGVLLGDHKLLLGDVANWLSGQSGRVVTAVMTERVPRVLVALLGGAALAVAGTMVQAVARNPLADPGLLGITGGASFGAVIVLSLVPVAATWFVSVGAGLGALVAFGLVYALSARGGLHSDRVVLVGVGVSAGATALTTLVIIATSPYNVAYALTWMSGTTYGRTTANVWVVVIALVLVVPLAFAGRRELDLVTLDDDAPRVLGLRLSRVRLVFLTAAALLTAAAVTAVGPIGFVGLVAPHAARALVGARHVRVIGIAALLGAVLVSLADTAGRTVIAPAQVPAGLLVALLGAPYFVWLLWRARGREAT